MYFFTDLDLLGRQDNNWSFLYTNASISMRTTLTSIHASKVNSLDAIDNGVYDLSMCAKCYAVCDGQIVVCPQLNSSGNISEVVNIIHKPTQQPHFPFPKIKYFIYRGVLLQSLFVGPETSGAYSIKDKKDLFFFI